MAFSHDPEEFLARAAHLVDRVLKGIKPADIPIEQPSRFSLAVNLQAAKVLGVTIPASVQMRADKIVQ
jgi:putative ABC transport system substrate-binding protein